VEIESTSKHGRAWGNSKWLVLVELVLVATIYVARQPQGKQRHCVLPLSFVLRVVRPPHLEARPGHFCLRCRPKSLSVNAAASGRTNPG
jgi:hypothetical protein